MEGTLVRSTVFTSRAKDSVRIYSYLASDLDSVNDRAIFHSQTLLRISSLSVNFCSINIRVRSVSSFRFDDENETIRRIESTARIV